MSQKHVKWPALISAFKQLRGELANLTAFSFAINFLVLAVPIFMIQVFDRVLTSHSFETLWVLAFGTVAALTVMAVLDLIRGRILARTALTLERSLATDLIKHQAYARIGDVTALRSFLAGPTTAHLLDLPWTPAFVLVIFILHPVLGWITLGGIAAFCLLAFGAEIATRDAVIKVRSADTRRQRLISGLDASVDKQARRNAGGRWTDALDDGMETHVNLLDRRHTFATIGRFLRLCLQVVLMTAAAAFVIGGEITAGAMIAASVIAARTLGPFERTQDAWRAVVELRAALVRLTNVSVAREQTDEAAPESPAKLEVRRIAVFDETAREPLLNNVAFEGIGGEMIGVTGPTGSGKTALARLLAGLETPTQGRILLDHRDLANLTVSDAGLEIAYLPQSPVLLPGTIAENISGFADASPNAVAKAAAQAGADAMIRELKLGYGTEAVASLPGGLRQRVALARAFFQNPRMLVMDEPYTFLDNAGVQSLLSAMERLRERGTLVLVVSQRPSVLAHCDRVVVLEDGNSRIVGRRKQADLKLLSGDPATPMSAAGDQAKKKEFAS